jgi:diaminopimelate epimerase
MKFFKLHGLGSDFVLFDGRDADNVDWNALAGKVCDRHTGVGADGMLVLLRSAIADVRMRAIGVDCREAVPNGIDLCAFSRFCFENGVTRGMTLAVETGAGVVNACILLKNGRTDSVCVDLGKPVLDAKNVPVNVDDRALGMLLTEQGRTFSFSAVRVLAPHAVVFTDPSDDVDRQKYGPLIETDPLFPEGANVDFAEVISNERIRLSARTRGAGETLASGTGACAALVACALSGKTGRKATVEFARGTLLVEWREADSRIALTCPTETVFSGVWNK